MITIVSKTLSKVGDWQKSFNDIEEIFYARSGNLKIMRGEA